MPRMVRSAAATDEREETYVSLLGNLLAAIVAMLCGNTLVLAGAIGFEPGTREALIALGTGIALILLSLDQAWRVLRKLG